ncbi:MAG: polyprenyl synthetase family protein [SAR324 cluster bacterium]|nr:polyprenyl synthetase family protein [SAR324 cluster bacterium]
MTTTLPRASATAGVTEYLKLVGKAVTAEVLRRIPNGSDADYLYPLMRDYPSRGGKGFRPALLLLGCELFGGNPEDGLNSAVALELFHQFALVHDDIEDSSHTRRGQPALHRIHGIPLALNAGDAMHGLVHSTLLDNHETLGPELALRVHRHLSAVMDRTFEGQALDIGWVAQNRFPTREEYHAMIVRKTGWYSGRGPCQCGALIAGASAEDLETIGNFGEALGMGFQIRDDLLNLTADSEHQSPTAGAGGYGKERGGDFAEGKRTLIVIELLERLPESEAERVRNTLLAEPEQTRAEDIAWCIEKAEASGAMDAVRTICQQHAQTARRTLDALPDTPARQQLSELTDYLALERQS